MPVAFGSASEVPLVMGQDALVTHSIVGLGKVSAKLEYKAPLIAPIKKGDEVGTLKVTVGDNGMPQEYPVYAGMDVAEAGFFGGIFQKIKILTGNGPAVN